MSISGDYIISGDDYINDVNDQGNNITKCGGAFIFKNENNTWTQYTKLVASDKKSYRYFGTCVCIKNNYILISSIRGSNTENYIWNGAVYIFKLNSNEEWVEQQKLVPSDPIEYHYFGYSVDINNDYVIIGASGDDENNINSGAVYIFKQENNVWNEYLKLTSTNGNEYDRYGDSVCLSDNYFITGAKYFDDTTIVNTDDLQKTINLTQDPGTLTVSWYSSNRNQVFMEFEVPQNFNRLEELNISGLWRDQGWGGTGHNGINIYIRNYNKSIDIGKRIEYINRNNDPTYYDSPINYTKNYVYPFTDLDVLNNIKPGDIIQLTAYSVSWGGWQTLVSNTTLEFKYTTNINNGSVYIYSNESNIQGGTDNNAGILNHSVNVTTPENVISEVTRTENFNKNIGEWFDNYLKWYGGEFKRTLKVSIDSLKIIHKKI